MYHSWPSAQSKTVHIVEQTALVQQLSDTLFTYYILSNLAPTDYTMCLTDVGWAYRFLFSGHATSYMNKVTLTFVGYFKPFWSSSK